MRRTLVYLSALSFVLSQNVSPVFSLSIRERSTAEHKALNTNTFHELQTRFSAAVSAERHINAFVQFQDSRVFGSENSTVANSANLDLHQGYLELNTLFDSDFNLSLGRRELAFDNQRIVGTVGWHNVGRTFDGFFLTHNTAGFRQNLFATAVRETTSLADSANTYFYGYHIEYTVSERFRLSSYFLNQQILQASNSLKTIGLYLLYSDKQFGLEFQIAQQFGEATAKTDYNALYLGFGANYKLDNNVKLSVLYEKLSGQTGSTNTTSFSPLYGTNHKFNGFQDKFFVGKAALPNNGLDDYKLGLSLFKSVNLAAHFFYNDEAVVDAITLKELDPFLGQEYDITYSYAYSKELTLSVGGSYFIFGKDYDTNASADLNMYLMFGFKL
jgi:hypothetical protein